MPAFTEDFASVADWTNCSGCESLAGHFFSTSSQPAGQPGGDSTAVAVTFDNTGGSGGSFMAARWDNVDGGSAGGDYWMAYAFYIADWNEMWQGGPAKTYSIIPHHTQFNDDSTFGGILGGPLLRVTSSTTGKLRGQWAGVGPDVTHQEWHTIRVHTRFNGADSLEDIYLDDTLVLSFAGDSGLTLGTYGPAVYDDQGFTPSATVYVAALTWSPDTDPGEPGGGGSGSDVAVSDPTAIVVTSEPTEPSPPGPLVPISFDLCGEDLIPIVTIDGVDVTHECLQGGWTPRLNRPAQATVTLPMDAAIGDCGSLLKIELSSGTFTDMVFHGMILNTETDTDKDTGTTMYAAQDAMELWQWRLLRADDADFTKPIGSGVADGTDLVATYVNAPSIMYHALQNSIQNPDGPNGGGPPLDAEGPLGLELGAYATGGVSMAGAPVDFPITLMDWFSLLVSTGQLDAVLRYQDPGDGTTAQVNFYNGDYGTDRTADVRFEYGTGLHTAQAVRWNRDMTNVVNKYQIFGGPQIKSAADPAGEQHWCFNVQGFDTGLAYPPGGRSVNTDNTQFIWPNNPLGEKIYASRQAYLVRMRVDIFDAFDDDCIPGFGTVGRELYRREWQMFSWLAAAPKEIIHVQPNPGIYVGCFGIGDLVHVEASSEVRGGFSGVQRVQQYTVSWEGPESVLSLSEIQTSSDAEIG